MRSTSIVVAASLGAGVLLAACAQPGGAPSPTPRPLASASMPMPGMPGQMPHGTTPSGDAAEPVTIPSDAQRVDVVGTEFAFSPETPTVEAGRPVVITFENDGTTAHDWTVHAQDGTEVAHAHAEPGDSTVVVMSFPKGTYKVWCTIAGHRQAGMVGRLLVT